MDSSSLFTGKTQREISSLKWVAVRGALALKTHRTPEHLIEVMNVETHDDGVDVFARVFTKNRTQIGFGDGSVDVERFRFFNPPILVRDPNGTIIREGFDELLGVKTETRYREDPQQAILDALEHTISVKKQRKIGSDKLVRGKIGNTTSTFYPSAGTGGSSVDGRVGYATASGTWSTVRDAATGTYATPSATNNIAIFVDATATTNRWENMTRFICLFDTSSIPDTDTVSSATFSLYPFSNGFNTFGYIQTVALVGSTPASDGNVTTADYDQFGTTEFASRQNIENMLSGSYTDFALNASGIAAISKTGASKFGCRIGIDVDNDNAWENNKEAGINIYQADQTGTSNDPKLVVEHAAAATTRVFIIS